MSRFRLLVAASLLAANSAGAQVLLNDSFNGLNSGNSALNFFSFPNFTVLNGTVDLVKSGDYGITCVGGAGLCVDLDGSRSLSGRLGTQTFLFGAGDTFTLNFDVSGNQRGGAADAFGVDFLFGAPTAYTNSFGTGVLTGAGVSGSFGVNYGVAAAAPLASNVPWTASSFGFTFVNAGQLSLSFYTTGNDNVGPMLDNVMITRTAPTSTVPEPSTYALMAAGLAVMGAVARRRRA
jgi:hypothetical protein